MPVFHVSSVQDVIDLYHALLHDDRDLARACLPVLGFQGPNREVINVLSRWASFVYGPLMETARER